MARTLKALSLLKSAVQGVGFGLLLIGGANLTTEDKVLGLAPLTMVLGGSVIQWIGIFIPSRPIGAGLASRIFISLVVTLAAAGAVVSAYLCSDQSAAIPTRFWLPILQSAAAITAIFALISWFYWLGGREPRQAGASHDG